MLSHTVTPLSTAVILSTTPVTLTLPAVSRQAKAGAAAIRAAGRRAESFMVAVRKVVVFCGVEGVFGLVNVLRCVWMMRMERADLLPFIYPHRMHIPLIPPRSTAVPRYTSHTRSRIWK